MATCHNCFQTIDHLINHQLTETIYRFEPKGRDGCDFMYIDEVVPNPDGDFECPECKSCLFTNAKEAYVFLKSKVRE